MSADPNRNARLDLGDSPQVEDARLVPSRRHVTRLMRRAILVTIVALTIPAPAWAQCAGQDPLIVELRRELQDLRAQLALIQGQMDELAAARAGAVPTPSTAPQPTQAARPAPGLTSAHLGEATSTYEVFSEDPAAAPRFDNAPVDPTYHGYFILPGTQTLLRIGGFFKTDVIYELEPTESPDQFIPSSILIPAVEDVQNANVSMRPTRLSLDFRVPSPIGDARFYVEGDLFGTNATTPRLRHAYAQARNLLVGQTFSTFMDPDAIPDLLDVRGPNGMDNVRNPQIRYGVALDQQTTLYGSIEKPASEVDVVRTPEFSSQPSAPLPDAAIRVRREFQAGHWQVASMFRSIAAFLPNGPRDSVFGWGLGTSGRVRLFGRDHLLAQATYGRGIARYIQDASGRGLDAALVAGPEPHLKAIPAVGTHVAYQHYWLHTLRSSLVYGYSHVQNTEFQPASTFRTSHYAAGNLIWNLFGALDVGAEYLFGRNEHKDGQAANASRVQVSMKYAFVRVDRDE